MSYYKNTYSKILYNTKRWRLNYYIKYEDFIALISAKDKHKYWYNYNFDKKKVNQPDNTKEKTTLSNFYRFYWQDLISNDVSHFRLFNILTELNDKHEYPSNEISPIYNILIRDFYNLYVNNKTLLWVKFYNKYLDRNNYKLQKRMFKWVCSFKTINGVQIPEDVENHIISFF
tara:strand:- start:640 stop:1158 length:519 start_codon:yes stop_codon:yes gene_type:complete